VYAMVDAVPDRGEVTVVRSNVTVIKTERTATVTVTDAGGYDEIPMTVALTVDGDVWTAARATQNGRIADARLETVAGVTTFYVTVTPNAGALTARAGAETAASRSMTDVYHRRALATPDIPVDISTPEELYMLSDYVHRDGFTEGVTFRLTDDLDLTGYPVFDPIGWEHLSEASSGNYYRHPFRGFFEGGGHTISGLRVFRTVCGAGLFGTINGGAVRHLTVIGNVRGIKRTGGICGDAICTEFEDVVFSGHVRSVAHEKDRNGGSYVGGLIGQADSCTLTGCLVVDADVDARAAATESRWSRYYSRFVETSNKSYNNGCSIGGLIGGFNVRYGSGGSVATVITDCAVYASVTAHSVYQRNTGEIWGGEKVGGLIGSGGGTLITDCLVDVQVRGRKNVGGVYGYQHNNPATKVYNTAAYGTVTALENAGGLDGWIGSNGSAYIDNCLCAVTSVQAESNAAVCIGLTSGDGKNYPRPAYVRYLPVGDLPVTNYGEGASGGTYATGTEAENLAALNDRAAAKGYGTWTIRGGRLDPTSLEVVRVDFVDGQGRVLAVRYARSGAAVTPPAVPDEPGRVFRGWSEDLSCVTASVTVTALFETVETCTVTFLGRGGETLAAGTVNRGAALPAVAAPTLTGLIFDGWQGMTGDTVEHDLTLTAGYRPDTAALAPLVEALDAAATSEQKHAAIRAVADFVALWNEEERDADLPVAYVAARSDYDRRSASGAADLAAALTLFGD
ncbi:MAG: InlB B-repeat-containing protein, partial [Clostridia bacterium]|nr:InlB B-repeat-containing protein [Clostridia bacterium]